MTKFEYQIIRANDVAEEVLRKDFSGPVPGHVAEVLEKIWNSFCLLKMLPYFGESKFNPRRLYYINVVNRTPEGIIEYVWSLWRDPSLHGKGGKWDNQIP